MRQTYNDYSVDILALPQLRCSEEVDVQWVAELAASIASASVWTTPIPLDRPTGIVMDGNHRLSAARLLGLTHLPCILIDYADPRVSVSDWHTGQPLDGKDIVRRVLNDRRLPYKSTRHNFAPSLPLTNIPLSALGLPIPRDWRAAAGA